MIPRSRIAGMQRLIENTRLLTRLNELRGWTPQAVMELGLGLDDDRVVFFYESPKGAVTGVNRYQPNPERRNGQPKGIAFGIRDLFPRPEDFDTTTCWLDEEVSPTPWRSLPLASPAWRSPASRPGRRAGRIASGTSPRSTSASTVTRTGARRR